MLEERHARRTETFFAVDSVDSLAKGLLHNFPGAMVERQDRLTLRSEACLQA